MSVTRPPALWLNDPNIRTLQEACKRYRREAHTPPHSEAAWGIFKDARNSLKKLIGKANRRFMTNALSYKRPKEVWKTIHCILHPSHQSITVYPDNKQDQFGFLGNRARYDFIELDMSTGLDKQIDLGKPSSIRVYRSRYINRPR